MCSVILKSPFRVTHDRLQLQPSLLIGKDLPAVYWFPACVTMYIYVQRDERLPTLLAQQCWELLRACWQWCANGCNNSQQGWDLQCIVGRIRPIRPWRSCVMGVCGPNNVGRAVQTDPTLLRHSSAITDQKKYWELLAQKVNRFQNLRNNS